MIRPIESSMSLYTVDHKAHQAQNAPDAHMAQAMQQNELIKHNQKQAQMVQKMPETEGEVKIRDGDSEKNKGGRGKKRKKEERPEEEPETGKGAPSEASGGGLNFLA
ncbi:MAG: hypothetical protein LBE65_03210 [Synergistaceae bacterium]|jgi:hypothetical protein|nr:hypothetical protein [Synergistaceae bacterium]